MEEKASGILMHISSLPCEYGIGDLGPQAYKFADFLKQAKQKRWQVLPINQIDPKGNYSPYNCLSAFVGNTLLISPELLVEEGLLTRKDVKDKPAFPKTKVDYRRVISYKKKLIDTAYERFKSRAAQKQYQKFCSDNNSWLEDYALFMAIRRKYRYSLWSTWESKLRDRKADALRAVKITLADSINKEKFQQYIFFRQWFGLKNYCNKRGIKLIGDIPIYVSYESADVWAHPEFFKLTKTKRPRFIAGVPPDFFSRRGQLWGNPVYDWQALKQANYRWWIQRIDHNLAMFDIVRIDHFRGFVGYWQVPVGYKNASKGKWAAGPKEDFFEKVFGRFPLSAFIVEDLGRITSDVRALIEKFQLTTTKVLLFAFGKNSATSPHNPRNYVKNSIVYTGTHDNNTIRGWFDNEADGGQKRRLLDYIGHKVPAGQVHWEFIKLAMGSVSNTVIIQMQDVLGLGRQARMNRPSTVKNNWRWRLRQAHRGRLAQRQIKAAVCERLAKMTECYGRG